MWWWREQIEFTFWWSKKRISFPFYSSRCFLKAAKYEIQKRSTCRAALFRCNFSSMFPVFHLAWSGWRNTARWLVDLLGNEQICCATSCVFDEKRATKPKFVAQSRPALYFSQQLFSTRNKCFWCATSWSCKVKNGKHRRKLATKQCCASSWGFLYLVFRRLKRKRKHVLSVFIEFYIITQVILIGSCLWSITGQTHDWHLHYKVFPCVLKWREDLRLSRRFRQYFTWLSKR